MKKENSKKGQAKESPGKDEMNLAEFPISVIGRRPPGGVKTLVFKDTVWDKGRNEWVNRKLIVTGSDLLGLPTQFDEEVLLACIQLTKQAGMKSRELNFTRRELMRLLGKNGDGRSNRRTAESFDRLTGTLVISEKAFWDKERKTWLKDTFTILDRVVLAEAEEGRRGEHTRSTLVWGDFMWRSFQAGNMKDFDFEFWKSLSTGTSKRLYRFLDKKFWFDSVLNFELKELAHEKIGLSRKMHTGQIKARLAAAHDELAARGFCRARFVKEGSRRWRVLYEKTGRRRAASPKTGKSSTADIRKRTSPIDSFLKTATDEEVARLERRALARQGAIYQQKFAALKSGDEAKFREFRKHLLEIALNSDRSRIRSS